MSAPPSLLQHCGFARVFAVAATRVWLVLPTLRLNMLRKDTLAFSHELKFCMPQTVNLQNRTCEFKSRGG
eukprot:3353538-Amphidinium_carterae.1